LQQISLESKDENALLKGIDSYKKAVLAFEEAEMPTHVAESQWRLAQLYDQLDKLQEASENYEHASEAYNLAAKKIPQLKKFYGALPTGVNSPQRTVELIVLRQTYTKGRTEADRWIDSPLPASTCCWAGRTSLAQGPRTKSYAD